MLDLASAAVDPQAAFLARVVAEKRDEEHLRTEAALYPLLAYPLALQAKLVAKLKGDAELTALLEEARNEYERLQEVVRDTRWRSGSYRHALRRALADLALLGGQGDRFEDQAIRLLQRRTERPEANAELLAFVSPKLRARYLEWAPDDASAESSPERALFAFAQLRVYSGAVDRPTIRRLLASTRAEVAIAAAAHLVTSWPTDAADDREIAELIGRIEVEESIPLIDAVVSDAPERLRFDLWLAWIHAGASKNGRMSGHAFTSTNATPQRSASIASRSGMRSGIGCAAASIPCAGDDSVLLPRSPHRHRVDRAIVREAKTVKAELCMPEVTVRATWAGRSSAAAVADAFSVWRHSASRRLHTLVLAGSPA